MKVRVRHYPFKKLTYKMAGSRRITNRGNCAKRKLYRARWMNRCRRERPEEYLWHRNLEARWKPFR
jgi:hypothetical protein